MFVANWALFVANFIISPISIISCLILFIIYRKLPQKSVAMKTICFICIFDFILEILNAILPLLSDFDICHLGTPFLEIVLLSSLLTSTLLARNSLKSVQNQNYNPELYFYQDIMIIVLMSIIYSLFPLIPNGFVTYGKLCCMQSPVEHPSIWIILAGSTYIVFPVIVCLGLSIYSYIKIYRLYKKFYGVEKAKSNKIRMRFVFMTIVWQIILYTPYMIIQIYAMDRKNATDLIAYSDLFLTRLAGVINCCIYFFIRIKRPEILKNPTFRQGLLEQGLQEILMSNNRSSINAETD